MLKFSRILLALILMFAMVAMAAPEKNVASAPASKSLVHWMPYDEALKTAQDKPRLIFVDMYAEWCVPCRVMDKNVYGNPTVAALLNTRFYPVKLDTDSADSIMCDGVKNTVRKCYNEVWELSALPAFVLVAPKGLSILTVTDSMNAEEMQGLLLKFLQKEKEWMER